MLQVRQREFAQLEEPIRMAGPLDFKVIAKVELQRDVLADEFIYDCAIIDAVDRNFSATVPVVQLAAILSDGRDVDGRNAARPLRHDEVALRLLMIGIDFQK